MLTFLKGYTQGYLTTLLWFNNPIYENYIGIINGIYCLQQEENKDV
jgi:hypothetical protein